MDRIIILKGDELASLIDFMEAITTGRERVYQLRVTVDGDQVKLKANSSTWTPGYGELDPECQAAQRGQEEGPTDWVQRLRPDAGRQESTVRLPGWPDPDARPTY